MMTRDERAAMIAQYAEGYDVLVASLDGITGAEWVSREAPGEWNTREIVHHMGDSEMISAVGFRLMIAKNGEPMTNYDQDHLAQTLRYDRPVDDSLAAFKYARASTLPLLESMTDEEWSHSGVLPGGKVIGVETYLTWYSTHAHKHADQITRARAAAHG